MPFSVYVVDTDRVLFELLARHMSSVGAAVDGTTSVTDALTYLEETQPEVLLLNPDMARSRELAELLPREHPGTALILLEDDPGTGADRAAGVAGVVSKRQSVRQLVTAVEGVVGRKSGGVASPQSKDDDGSAPEKGSVLVVDDDPAVSRLFRKMLTNRGHDVETASTGEEVLPILNRGYGIRVVLLDLIIAPTGGLETMRQILQMPNPPHVVIVSAVSDADILRNVIRMGAFAYLTKPVSESQLLETVERALRI